MRSIFLQPVLTHSAIIESTDAMLDWLSAEHGRTRRDLARAAQNFRRASHARKSFERVFSPRYV